MKLKIEGMTEEEILEVIEKVAKNHRNKDFDIYDCEDIEQEVKLICLHILNKFNDSKSIGVKEVKKSLEHFLNASVANRLTNFYRDKYLVPQKQFKSDKTEYDKQLRINLKHPLNVEEILVELKTAPENYAKYKEFVNLVVQSLDEENKDVLEAILSGEKVNTYFRKRLWKKIINMQLDSKVD